jgi:hypothetical protein
LERILNHWLDLGLLVRDDEAQAGVEGRQ